MNSIKLMLVVEFAKLAYKTVLRDLLIRAVEDTDNDIDDHLVGVMDRVFDYE